MEEPPVWKSRVETDHGHAQLSPLGPLSCMPACPPSHFLRRGPTGACDRPVVPREREAATVGPHPDRSSTLFQVITADLMVA